MFDAKTALQSLVASLPQQRGPRLSFRQRCAAYYAVQMGVPHHLVAKALNVSPTLMSLIAHCADPGARHYRSVAKAFRELGPEAFRDRYYDDEFHTLLMNIKVGRAHPPPARGSAPLRSADAYANFEFNVTEHDRLIVEWAPKNPPWREDWGSDHLNERRYAEKEGWSWRYADSQPLSSAFADPRYPGTDPTLRPYAGVRFRTSRQAYEHAHAAFGATAPD